MDFMIIIIVVYLVMIMMIEFEDGQFGEYEFLQGVQYVIVVYRGVVEEVKVNEEVVFVVIVERVEGVGLFMVWCGGYYLVVVMVIDQMVEMLVGCFDDDEIVWG